MQGTREELGRLVTERRLRLGMMRQEDLAAAAGLRSRTTIAAVENGRSVKPWTLDRLDSALGWRVGSSRLFLRDGTLPVLAATEAEFTDPAERRIWAITELTEARRREIIADLQAERARLRAEGADVEDGPPVASTG